MVDSILLQSIRSNRPSRVDAFSCVISKETCQIMMFVSTIAYIYYKLCASDNYAVYSTQRNTTCSKDNTLNVPNNPLGALIPSFLTNGCNCKVLYLFGPV